MTLFVAVQPVLVIHFKQKKTCAARKDQRVETPALDHRRTSLHSNETIAKTTHISHVELLFFNETCAERTAVASTAPQL